MLPLLRIEVIVGSKVLARASAASLTAWCRASASGLAPPSLTPRESNVFVLFYDVGELIRPRQAFASGDLHEVLMTPSELKDSYKLLDGWFEKCGKAHADYHLLKIIKSGLKAGADWSTARILCNNA